MSDKATPRPWAASNMWPKIYGGPRAFFVAEVTGDDDEAHANRALIVAAVNAHEAHQRAAEALRELLPLLTAEPEGTMAHMSDLAGRLAWYLSLRPIKDEARAALAELDRVQR